MRRKLFFGVVVLATCVALVSFAKLAIWGRFGFKGDPVPHDCRPGPPNVPGPISSINAWGGFMFETHNGLPARWTCGPYSLERDDERMLATRRWLLDNGHEVARHLLRGLVPGGRAYYLVGYRRCEPDETPACNWDRFPGVVTAQLRAFFGSKGHAGVGFDADVDVVCFRLGALHGGGQFFERIEILDAHTREALTPSPPRDAFGNVWTQPCQLGVAASVQQKILENPEEFVLHIDLPGNAEMAAPLRRAGEA